VEKHQRSSLRVSLSPPRCSVILAASLACFLLLTAKLPAQETQPAETQKISGTVVNSVTHEPIARALVYSPDDRFAALTDSEGQFEFTIPAPAAPPDSRQVFQSNSRPAGLNWLIARKPGFLNDSVQRMSLDPSGKELTIPLVPEALIIGHIVLPSSEPPDRIQVQLYRRQVRDGRAHWEMQASVMTRSTGEFRFADLRAGSYKLLTGELLDRDPLTFNPQGQQFGYPPVYFPSAGDFVSAQTIELTPGKTFQADITLVKQPYYPVKIAAANPLPGGGMQLLVYPHGHRGPGYSLGAGNNIEGLLPSGTYTVEAASGFGANSSAGSATITVRGAPLETASIALVPTGSISVNVKEEFTNPGVNTGSAVEVNVSPGANPSTPGRYLNISLAPADDFALLQGAALRPPTSPEDQSLVIESVGPGRYWVKINSQRGFASSATCGGIDLQHQPLVFTGGASPPIEVTMRDDWAEVDGTVEGISTYPEAKPMPFDAYASEKSAHVYFVPLPDSSGEFREAWVGSGGKFNAQQIPPGVYRVLAFDHRQPDLEYQSAEAMRAYESKGQVVRLVGNQKEHLRLQLIATNE
jgi:hypothetical protein